mmetsp:Transcript_22509/g.72450  ORF Transcript_22509/g.72450 Transcript_22509/m.72450 type:complete len:234 (+) Transcript_22509:101-802(+)
MHAFQNVRSKQPKAARSPCCSRLQPPDGHAVPWDDGAQAGPNAALRGQRFHMCWLESELACRMQLAQLLLAKGRRGAHALPHLARVCVLAIDPCQGRRSEGAAQQVNIHLPVQAAHARWGLEHGRSNAERGRISITRTGKGIHWQPPEEELPLHIRWHNRWHGGKDLEHAVRGLGHSLHGDQAKPVMERRCVKQDLLKHVAERPIGQSSQIELGHVGHHMRQERRRVRVIVVL